MVQPTGLPPHSTTRSLSFGSTMTGGRYKFKSLSESGLWCPIYSMWDQSLYKCYKNKKCNKLWCNKEIKSKSILCESRLRWHIRGCSYIMHYVLMNNQWSLFKKMTKYDGEGLRVLRKDDVWWKIQWCKGIHPKTPHWAQLDHFGGKWMVILVGWLVGLKITNKISNGQCLCYM